MPDPTRYSRQEKFAPIGADGQCALQEKRVLLVGCGALGASLAEMLVRAGVGALTLVDRDVLEESNLQRQCLYTEADARAGLPKAVAAERRLMAINSGGGVRGIVADFTPENALDLAEGADLILDGTDNFETRFLINDVAVKFSIPWVYAACVGSRALAMPVIPSETACLACVMEELPPVGGETCDSAGIIMPAVLMAAAMAGAEALKILTNRRDALIRKLRMTDVWTGEERALSAAHAHPDCIVCGCQKFAHLSGRAGTKTVTLCGRNAVQITPARRMTESLSDVAGRVSGTADVLARNEFLVQLGARGMRLTLFADGRALVSGTSDPAAARALYAQLIGA